MSVAVGMEELRSQIERFGQAFLLTVTDDGRPHAVSAPVAWDGDVLVVPAGARTAANAADRPVVTLLWPAVEPGGYSLIVDGEAVVDGGPGGRRIAVRPVGAVLHRSVPPGAGAAAGGSECVRVLDGP